MSIIEKTKSLIISSLTLAVLMALVPAGLYARGGHSGSSDYNTDTNTTKFSSTKSSDKNSKVSKGSTDTSSFDSKNYDLGLAVGMWMGGTVTIEDLDVDKDTGLLFRGFADAYLLPKFAVGCFFNYSSVEASYYDYSASGDIYEFGVALKPRFAVSPVVAIKPGLNIGYRKGQLEGYESINGLGINLSVELQYMMNTDYIVFFEGGFLSQPTGGNADASVTWAPIPYFAVGLCF